MFHKTMGRYGAKMQRFFIYQILIHLVGAFMLLNSHKLWRTSGRKQFSNTL